MALGHSRDLPPTRPCKLLSPATPPIPPTFLDRLSVTLLPVGLAWPVAAAANVSLTLPPVPHVCSLGFRV
eukprot:66654-Chlamydomonas_euryale.AAC.5